MTVMQLYIIYTFTPSQYFKKVNLFLRKAKYFLKSKNFKNFKKKNFAEAKANHFV